MIKPLTLIGLTGPAGCGKDTVADLLVAHCGFKKLAFADTLRAEVAHAFQLDIRMLTDRTTKELPLEALALDRCTNYGFVGALTSHNQDLDLAVPRSPRQIMQWWGTEYRRASDDNYWVYALLRRIGHLVVYEPHQRYVVTDVRFANEAEILCKGLKGKLWQIKRPGFDVSSVAHASETSGAAFAPSAVINNCAEIRHLQQIVLSEYLAHETGLPGLTVNVPEGVTV